MASTRSKEHLPVANALNFYKNERTIDVVASLDRLIALLGEAALCKVDAYQVKAMQEDKQERIVDSG